MDVIARITPLTQQSEHYISVSAQIAVDEIKRLRAENERLKTDAERWQFYAKSPQTALMLGSNLDPNDDSVDWPAECNILADRIRNQA